MLNEIYEEANIEKMIYTLPSQTYALFLSCCFKVINNPLTTLKTRVEFLLTYNNFIDFILENMQSTTDITYRFLTNTDVFMYKHAVEVKKLLNSIDKLKVKLDNGELTNEQVDTIINDLYNKYPELYMSMQNLYIEFLKSIALIQESYIRWCRKANKDFLPPKLTPLLGETLTFLANHTKNIKALQIGTISEPNLEKLLSIKNITVLPETARKGDISKGCMFNGKCEASAYDVVLKSSLNNKSVCNYIKCLHVDYTCYIAISNYLTTLQTKYPDSILILNSAIYEDRIKLLKR